MLTLGQWSEYKLIARVFDIYWTQFKGHIYNIQYNNRYRICEGYISASKHEIIKT